MGASTEMNVGFVKAYGLYSELLRLVQRPYNPFTKQQQAAVASKLVYHT
jgi:hypothetical protein